MLRGFFDTECYQNYWLFKAKINGVIYTVRLVDDASLDEYNKSIILSTFRNTMVSFNGIGYDIPVIRGALAGYNTTQLKWITDQIIVHGVRPWELPVGKWTPPDHVDIMEVAPGIASQKIYAGRIHSKTMRDLPYDPNAILTAEQMKEVDDYCENDLAVLEELHATLAPQLHQRVELSKRYGMDLRSKSDAQLAEAVLKRRCETLMGRSVTKPDIDWNLRFKYEVPAFISFQLPVLQAALETIRGAVFSLGKSGAVEMPSELQGLEISIGSSTYRLGIGGLHSSEKSINYQSDATHVLRDSDVASYYPTLILNSGKWPPALGPAFIKEYEAIKDERLAAKSLQGKLKKSGDTTSPEYIEAHVGNEGGKIMINGSFGKTGSPYSILFAPEMLIQTTVTGQLALLMIIEWHEHHGIPIVSANTDGIVAYCPRDKLPLSDWLLAEWEKRTGLTMETVEYAAIYSRDVNNYIAIKNDREIKAKGEYAKGGLIAKKNPDIQICAEAVGIYLRDGIHPLYTISACQDIRQFVTVRQVTGGAKKMHGVGPNKKALVRDMVTTLMSCGWSKEGRKWGKGGVTRDPRDAYESCFAPQTEEYLGKVVRWYYGRNSPGAIVYAKNGNQVPDSEGARPAMVLPDEFPDDIDYVWYLRKTMNMLNDLGVR